MSIKKWLLACAMLGTVSAQAEDIYTTVFNVLDINTPEKKVLLLLSGADGKVYRANRTEENLKSLKALTGQIVKLSYQAEGTKTYLTDIRLADRNEVNPREYDLNHFQYNELRKFAPTNLQSLDEVTDIFNNMLNDGDKNRSQCFKRAHMWSYDMWVKSGITSQKIFMFYTSRYQIVDEFDWWFHVAPLVIADGTEYVLDGTFMKKPVTVKEWMTYFMRTDKITCPEIKKYQQYENNQWTKLCYIMKTSMYHFRPLDIEMRDKNGVQRNHWDLSEIQDARRAFKNWEDTYEGLDTGKKTVKY